MKTTIGLRIELNKDSGLDIRSYTLLRDGPGDSITVCRVKVLKHKVRRLIIQEIDSTGGDAYGLQKMYLRYRQKGNREILEGNWYTNPHDKYNSGSISFMKLQD